MCVRHSILVTQKATNTHINLSVEFSFLRLFLIVRIDLLVLPLNLVNRNFRIIVFLRCQGNTIDEIDVAAAVRLNPSIYGELRIGE